MHNITWIGNNLGITDDKGGLEATQKGDFTVINVGTEANNPKADIIAPLPLFSVDPNILDKLSTVIEEIVKESSGTKSKVVIHDVFGIERSGLVAAWTIHKANRISLEDAYKKVMEKNSKVQDYSDWVTGNDKEVI